MLKTILSIPGKPGLFKLISQAKKYADRGISANGETATCLCP